MCGHSTIVAAVWQSLLEVLRVQFSLLMHDKDAGEGWRLDALLFIPFFLFPDTTIAVYLLPGVVILSLCVAAFFVVCGYNEPAKKRHRGCEREGEGRGGIAHCTPPRLLQFPVCVDS